MAQLQIKRIYEPFSKDDGLRILVDHLWPRGIKKENARLDHWMKNVAPSTELRKWFDHDPEKWDVFKHKYQLELKQQDAINELVALLEKNKHITLLYAAHDEQHNHAIVLESYLESLIKDK